MTFFQIIDILYNGSSDDIFKIVKQSIYSEDFAKEEELNPSIAVHTGFCFKIHTCKKFEVLFHVKTNKVIRQPHIQGISRPQLIGLICEYHGLFFSEWRNYEIVTKITDGEPSELYVDDLPENTFFDRDNTIKQFNIRNENDPTKTETINKFIVFKEGDNSVIKEFPLSKNWDKIMFLNGGRIEKPKKPYYCY